MECSFEVSGTDAPHTLPNISIMSNSENPKKSNLLRIKIANIRKHEGEVSATIPRCNDEQKKASESSRFECEPVMSSHESLNTCNEELVEDLSASKTEEIVRQAHDNIDNIDSKHGQICKIGNKSFEFQGALTGHKRIHSDKIVKKEVPYQGGSSNQVLFNLEHTKVKWNTKGKRRQKGKQDDDSNDEMIDAAENLLYFSSVIHLEAAQNGNRGSTIPNPRLFKEASEIQVGGEDGIIVASYTQQVQTYKEKSKKMLGSQVILSVCDDEEIMVTSTPNAIENVGTSSNQENCASRNDVCTEILSEKFQQKRIKLESGQTDASRVYVCQSCNRTFSSYQALGGHVVIHNKGKKKQGEAVSKMSEHKCKICSIVYETVPSLCGHMRKHWLTLQKIKEDNSNGSDKLCSSNEIKEPEQLPYANEVKGKQGLDESSSADAMEETETEQLPTVNEDASEEVGESSPGNIADQTLTRPIFDLNELPDGEDKDVLIREVGESLLGNTADQTLTLPSFDLNELPDEEDRDVLKLQF